MGNVLLFVSFSGLLADFVLNLGSSLTMPSFDKVSLSWCSINFDWLRILILNVLGV